MTLGTASAYDLHYRLRPTLREIAAGLLADRRGIGLDGEPERARAAARRGDVGARARRTGSRPATGSAAGLRRRSSARSSSAGGALMHELARGARARAPRILDEVERAVVGKRERSSSCCSACSPTATS